MFEWRKIKGYKILGVKTFKNSTKKHFLKFSFIVFPLDFLFSSNFSQHPNIALVIIILLAKTCPARLTLKSKIQFNAGIYFLFLGRSTHFLAVVGAFMHLGSIHGPCKPSAHRTANSRS